MTRGVRKLSSMEQMGYRPGAKKARKTTAELRLAAYEALSDEEKAADRQRRAEDDADNLQWRRDFVEHGPARAGEMLIARKAARGGDKIADFYARQVVEGDTDLNHDNVEPAK